MVITPHFDILRENTVDTQIIPHNIHYCDFLNNIFIIFPFIYFQNKLLTILH